MAAVSIPAPGTEYGPCVGSCEHRDCAANRATAESLCEWCDEPIDYGRRYYSTDTGYVHETCELQAIEEGRSD